ncbi:hypothetical protein D3C81_1789220 [compost metagenome]
MGNKSLNGFLLEQGRTPLGDHDRIGNQISPAIVPDFLGNGTDQPAAEQHAGFDGIRCKILPDGIELCSNSFRLQRIYTLHPEGVLCCHCGEGRHAVDTQLLKGFEIGLDTGTAPAVRAGDGQSFANFSSI